MFEIGFNPVRECWQLWNADLCKPVNGIAYASEDEALAALRAFESRVFSHSRRDSYFSRVLLAAH